MDTFFTVLMPGSDFRQKLALSKNFVSEFGSKLPEETVVLKVPTGKTMSVGLTRTEDDTFFEHGWAEFVVEHFLEENDFLVFTFVESSSCFEVLLFDKTACGKKVVASTEDSVDSRSTHSLQITKDCSDDVLSGTESSSGNSSSDSSWHISDTSSSLVKRPKRGTTNNTKNATVANQQTSTFRGKAQSSRLLKSKEKSAGTSRKPLRHRFFQSERRPVTTEEKDMALRKAQVVRSTRPHFIRVMKPSYVYTNFYMTLPVEFVNQQLFQVPVTALLQVTGSSKTWEVSIYRRNAHVYNGQVGTGRGWADFVMDNNLEEADVCLFELDFNPNRKDIAMFDVTIFRVVDKIVPLKKIMVYS